MNLWRSQTPRPTRTSTSKSLPPHAEIVTQQWSAVKEQVRLGFNTMFEQNGQLESRLNDSFEENTELQKQITELKKELEVKNTSRSANDYANDYALVIVDGDGMIFERNLISDGKAGGMKAAKCLHDRVAKETGLHPVIRVFANVAGLSSMVVRAQWIRETNAFRAFIVGFSDPALGQIDFVDVGSGRDKVAEKFRGEFNWHRKNYNCRSILLGIGYDNGYARLLDQTVTQDTAVEIQLIEGPPLGWEINAMKLKKFQCKGVFSSENLDFYPAHTNNTAEPQSSNQADITSHPTSPSNPEFEAFQILRDFEPKPCYSLYLAGSCARRASCEKGHEFVLNAKQMQALATTAKTMRCKFGKDCWNRDKCFYSGH